MLDCKDENRDCNYKCNCGCEDNNEEVMPTKELPEHKECPRDCKREEMAMKIKELDFAIVELSLYLDTHPDDRNAIRMHCEYSQRQISLTEEYQRLYGPLTINFMSDTWDWIDEPWPWERGAY